MKYILKKKNRTISTELEKVKDSYLKDGYTCYDEKGKLISLPTNGITYTAKQYNDLMVKYLALKEQSNKVGRPRTKQPSD